ncbi:hypothetical protein KA005_39280 [bacterium]|nr:hypothetical protein [bacterium]
MSGVYIIFLIIFGYMVGWDQVGLKDAMLVIVLFIGDMRHFSFSLFRNNVIKFNIGYNETLKKLQEQINDQR